MTPFACAEITKTRLRLWQKRNEKDGLCSTPAVLVNICHGNNNVPMVVNTVEDLDNVQIVRLLRGAADLIEREAVKGN
jgi:hypothetical protein